MSLATGRGEWPLAVEGIPSQKCALGAGGGVLGRGSVLRSCAFMCRDPRRCLRALQSHGQVCAGLARFLNPPNTPPLRTKYPHESSKSKQEHLPAKCQAITVVSEPLAWGGSAGGLGAPRGLHQRGAPSPKAHPQPSALQEQLTPMTLCTPEPSATFKATTVEPEQG